MSDYEKFIKLAIKKFGVKEAKLISTGTIYVEEWVRIKCQYGCEVYNKCLTCPPYSPKPAETRKIINFYKSAILLYHPDYKKLSEIVVELEEEIFLDGFYKVFSFGAGPCHLCKTCDTIKGCKYPYKARPAMEAAGIDVFKTVRSNNWKIEVIKDYDKCAKYFGVVLIE